MKNVLSSQFLQYLLSKNVYNHSQHICPQKEINLHCHFRFLVVFKIKIIKYIKTYFEVEEQQNTTKMKILCCFITIFLQIKLVTDSISEEWFGQYRWPWDPTRFESLLLFYAFSDLFQLFSFSIVALKPAVSSASCFQLCFNLMNDLRLPKKCFLRSFFLFFQEKQQIYFNFFSYRKNAPFLRF